MRRSICLSIALLSLVSAALAHPAENATPPTVLANDNRRPAGQTTGNTLEVRLELRAGRWYPEDEGGPYRDVYAFAEEGRAPQIAGPLIRARQGTQIHVKLHNALPVPAKVYGLHSHPGDAKDSVTLAAGESREVRFEAGEPGTYLYSATTSDKPVFERDAVERELSGAFVVDADGAKSDDRIFVIGILASPSSLKGIPSINGKSWPFTERVTYKTGETIHWRVINASNEPHGMHLHGFYFTVDGVGDGDHFERYAADQGRKGVTEMVDSFHVFEMTWMPDRSGNWLFHCHMVTHMSVQEELHPKDAKVTEAAEHTPGHGQMAGMGGLVIGITVLPSESAASAPAVSNAKAPRKLQLAISENPSKRPLYKVELIDPLKPAEPNKADAPPPAVLLGPPIVLTRGEPTEIEIKNQCSGPTVIHWHGMELESYYDGVAGWTGSGKQTTPPIPAGTSFVARMTPPRAGTFIYHSHWHDDAQLKNGIYGPLIVLEPGQKYDPEHDRAFVYSYGAYDPFGILLLVNGSPQPDSVELTTGTKYRFRLVNITSDAVDLRVRLVSNDVPVRWRVIAKDGADLPASQLKVTAADMPLTVGETYDVEYQAESPGQARLEAWETFFPTPVTLPMSFVNPK